MSTGRKIKGCNQTWTDSVTNCTSRRPIRFPKRIVCYCLSTASSFILRTVPFLVSLSPMKKGLSESGLQWFIWEVNLLQFSPMHINTYVQLFSNSSVYPWFIPAFGSEKGSFPLPVQSFASLPGDFITRVIFFRVSQKSLPCIFISPFTKKIVNNLWNS